ncbi:MAG: metallophosphoesterase [Crenarchaeota archaeon]|nr:metallophosphoesterase [Thermoproteota archaeon]
MDDYLVEVGEAGKKGLLLVKGIPAVYVSHANAFILADLHLGFEEVMADTGVFLPRIQLKTILKTIRELSMIKPSSRIVIAGDVKHCFQKLRRQERIELAKLVRELQRLNFKEILIVRGNHDNYAKTVLSPLGIELIEDSLDLGKGIVVAHGHKNVEEDYEYLIMGHEHPALKISVGGGRAKFPVFLIMPLENGSDALILPPAGPYQVGNIISTERRDYLSPIIQEIGIPEEALPIVLDEDTGLMPLVRLSLLEEILAL